jgi:hypothetical protein
MRKSILFAGIFVILFALIILPDVHAQDVKVSMYMLNLGKFDTATGTFTADFYLDLQCDTNCSPENFEFMNGRATSIDKIIDTPTEKYYRIQASLNSPVDLRRFPFDTQEMKIIIEDKENNIDEIRYVPDDNSSGIDKSVTFIGWKLDSWKSSVTEHYYDVYNETYSQYQFSINISKIFFNSFIKTFLPIIFIMLIVMFSFLLDTDKIMTRLTMTTAALTASVMFHISISNQIPPVGYMTMADQFMLVTYFILLATIVLNVFLLKLVEKKHAERVERYHKMTEFSVFIIIPAIYLAWFLITYFLF